MINQTRLTHRLQYEQRNGAWKDGFLAYSVDEARGIARSAARRTGRKVRIIEISTGRAIR